MSALLASNVISSGELLWLLFLYFGLPVLLLVGMVVLAVVMLRPAKKQDDAETGAVYDEEPLQGHTDNQR
jgi:4-hydroxybenzoate polyprenyltransferase